MTTNTGITRYLPGFFNFLDFGADPTGNQPADKPFLDALAAADGGGVLVIPPGSYRLAADLAWGAVQHVTIWLHAQVSFVGAGDPLTTDGTNTVRDVAADTVGFDALTLLTEQPNVADLAAVRVVSDGSDKKVTLANLGIHIRPNANGQLPGPTEAIWAGGVPGITIEGQVVIPYRRLHPGHDEVAEWATIDPATDAEEVPDDWALSTEYAVGDKVTRAGSYYEANRAHTAAGGNVEDGAPDEVLATAWDDYTLITVLAGFRGVFHDTSHVPTPADGDWGVFVGQSGYARIAEYNAIHLPLVPNWIYFFPHIWTRFIGHHANEAAATRNIGTYAAGTTVVAAEWGGKLRVLTELIPAAAEYVDYEWRARPTGNPMAVFWAKDSVQRWDVPRDANTTRNGFVERLLWKTSPSEAFFGGEVLGIRVLDGSDVSDADLAGSESLPDAAYFQPGAGLWRICAAAGAGGNPVSNTMRLLKVLSGSDDNLLDAGIGWGTTSASFGTPNINRGQKINAELIQLTADDVLYIVVVGTTAEDYSHYVIFERLGD